LSLDTNYTVVPAATEERVSLRPPGTAAPAVPHTHAKLDRLGIWLSTACAIHCMVMPIILISFPVMSWIRWSRMADIIAISVAAVFGLGGCLLSIRHHRTFGPLCLVVTGLTMNAVGRFAAAQLGSYLGQFLVITGPLVMAYGMWKDRRLCTCRDHTH
jgi:hypothetical protein